MQNVLWVVQQATAEMGLPVPAEVVTSQNETARQLLALLTRAGNEMVIGYPWTHLIKEFTITTVAGQNSYELPDDYAYLLDQTQWDRTNHWPLLGPKTAQEWQWLKSGSISSGPRLRYRLIGGKFEIFPTDSSDGATIATEYVSNGWLRDVDVANTFYSIPVHDTDVITFDEWVISAYLKLKFYEAKGLDTTAFSADFVRVWESRIGKSGGGPVLKLAYTPRTGLIGAGNIPDGNWAVGP